jgi:hypothetical protein
MAALAGNLGCLAGTFTVGAAVIASFPRLATAGGVSAFLVFCHISSIALDAILHANWLIFSGFQRFGYGHTGRVRAPRSGVKHADISAGLSCGTKNWLPGQVSNLQ